MIVVKIINKRLAQVVLAPSTPGYTKSSIIQAKDHRLNLNFTRHLVQSTSQNQKTTVANNQQLIPIARNISFRECRRMDRMPHLNAHASSISGPMSHFVSADLDSSVFEVDEENESTFESFRRRAKDAVAKKPMPEYYNQSFNKSSYVVSEKRLVVLMSWLEARESHIEKYRQFYLERGFDVLNVKTSPLDLLLPSIGAKKISKDFVRFIVEKEYSDVVLHGFSVGGYMFGQVLLDIDQESAEIRDKVMNSIKGCIFDSLVPFEGTCIGVSKSLTRNKFLAKMIEQILRLYLVVGHRVATKYYLAASEKVWGGPIRCPSLFLMSKDDIISDHKIVGNLIDGWDRVGIETHRLLVDESPHVQIYNKHREAYIEKVETFLKRISMF